jgi:hypothetical protein
MAEETRPQFHRGRVSSTAGTANDRRKTSGGVLFTRLS